MYLDCEDIKKGMKVRYQYPDHGNKWDLHKLNTLVCNQLYTVRNVHVGRWYTDVWLYEVEGIFNSVIFEYPQPWKHTVFWLYKWYAIKRFFNRKVF